MRAWRFLFILGLLLSALTSSVSAEEPPFVEAVPDPAAAPSPPYFAPQTEGVLSLSEAIQMALDHNLGLLASKIGIDSDELNVMIQEGLFDPRLTLSLDHSDRERAFQGTEADPITGTVNSNTTDFSAAAILPTRTGGSWSLTYEAIRNDPSSGGSSNGYGSSTLLRYTMPLLEGSGNLINHSPIEQARIGAQVTAANFAREALSLEATVVSQYLAVLRAQRQLDTAHKSLEVAQGLRKQTQAEVDAGVLARFELINAEGGIATREEGVLLAEQNIADAYSILKQTLGIPLDTPIVLSDELNVAPVGELSFDSLIDQALVDRPELQAFDLRQELANLQLEDAEDRLQNELTFNASAGVDGEGDSYRDSLDDMNKFAWSLGLEYTIPLSTDHRAKAQAEQARLALDQLALSRGESETQIRLALERALRDLRVSYERLAITATGVTVAEQRLANEQARLDLGLSTSQLVLDAEESLSDARRRRIEAELDYAQSKATLVGVLGLSQLAPPAIEPALALPEPAAPETAGGTP
ncbi:MAG: TolC family protein [bacterium]